MLTVILPAKRQGEPASGFKYCSHNGMKALVNLQTSSAYTVQAGLWDGCLFPRLFWCLVKRETFSEEKYSVLDNGSSICRGLKGYLASWSFALDCLWNCWLSLLCSMFLCDCYLSPTSFFFLFWSPHALAMYLFPDNVKENVQKANITSTTARRWKFYYSFLNNGPDEKKKPTARWLKVSLAQNPWLSGIKLKKRDYCAQFTTREDACYPGHPQLCPPAHPGTSSRLHPVLQTEVTCSCVAPVPVCGHLGVQVEDFAWNWWEGQPQSVTFLRCHPPRHLRYSRSQNALNPVSCLSNSSVLSS